MLIAHNRALRAIEVDLDSAGAIPLTWYDVLLELRGAAGPLRMTELGERVVLSRTRVSRLVQELETKGLVERTPDSIDGRATVASITRAGHRALSKAAPIYMDGIARHFTNHLTAPQQRAITAGLSSVVAAHPTSEGP